MNLEKYAELTGETVAPSQEAKIKATIRRTKSQLETLLGFSLTPKNLYTELGKVQFEATIPTLDDLDNLLPPDEQEGAYKIFPYKETDEYLHVDPFTNIYHVKLVIPYNDGEFVTVVDLDEAVADYGRDGVGKYIKRQGYWFTWGWYSWAKEYENGLMVAVDADWIDCYPDDLMYLWADMVSYYGNENYSVMGSLKSESVTGHSWSRGNAGGSVSGDTPPKGTPTNRLLLQRYAGPFGAVKRNPAR